MYLLANRRRHREAAELNLRSLRRMRENRQAFDPFRDLSDRAFKSAFRLTKMVCRQLIEILMVSPASKRGLTVERQILCALRFFATGSYQSPVGSDLHISMSQPSVSRSIREVAKAIVDNLAKTYIKFPKEDERDEIKQKFYNIGMTGVIGLVDGTHIIIKRPTCDVEHAYFAVRKSTHTKNVQIVCDADLRILSINPKYGESSHDSFVWNNSILNRHLQNEFAAGVRNSYLLGDSGYGQQPWLFTPISNPRTPNKARYNAVHQNMRHIVERCIGVLKSRFRCLCRQRILMYSPGVSGTIINACATLHNILIDMQYPLPDDLEEYIERDEDDDRIYEIMDSVTIRIIGVNARARLIRGHF